MKRKPGLGEWQLRALDRVYRSPTLRLVLQPRRPVDPPLSPLSIWTDEPTARDTLRANPRKRNHD